MPAHSRGITTPIILLTALGSEEDRIQGLSAGADDYLTKPFSPRELVLRVQSILRRSVAVYTPESVIDFGRFRLDPSARRASKDGAELALTSREFDLLEFFVKHPNQAFSRPELFAGVWGWTVGDLSTVTVHVRRLREKIEAAVTEPEFIVTVWGVGYRFERGSSNAASLTSRYRRYRARGLVHRRNRWRHRLFAMRRATLRLQLACSWRPRHWPSLPA